MGSENGAQAQQSKPPKFSNIEEQGHQGVPVVENFYEDHLMTIQDHDTAKQAAFDNIGVSSVYGLNLKTPGKRRGGSFQSGSKREHDQKSPSKALAQSILTPVKLGMKDDMLVKNFAEIIKKFVAKNSSPEKVEKNPKETKVKITQQKKLRPRKIMMRVSQS